ncbi:MAG: hypothetical protein MUF02_03615 [Acidobacteria bacterium]|nr:hypothetical protein [Acidobacteriota bacterium]
MLSTEFFESPSFLVTGKKRTSSAGSAAARESAKAMATQQKILFPLLSGIILCVSRALEGRCRDDGQCATGILSWPWHYYVPQGALVCIVSMKWRKPGKVSVSKQNGGRIFYAGFWRPIRILV